MSETSPEILDPEAGVPVQFQPSGDGGYVLSAGPLEIWMSEDQARLLARQIESELGSGWARSFRRPR
jgi:hypothetical protein